MVSMYFQYPELGRRDKFESETSLRLFLYIFPVSVVVRTGDRFEIVAVYFQYLELGRRDNCMNRRLDLRQV